MSLDVFVFADVNGKKDMVDRRGGAKVDTLAVRFCIHLFYLPYFPLSPFLSSPFLSSPFLSSPCFVFARLLFPTVGLDAPHVTPAVVLLSLALAVGCRTLYLVVFVMFACTILDFDDLKLWSLKMARGTEYSNVDH